MMFLRRIALAIGLIFAGLASQFPEFAQQYRQRLGGALDELTSIVARFDADAANAGMDQTKALDALEANGEQIARDRGNAMRETIVRRARLADQTRKFETSGSFGRLVALASDFDPRIARRAWGAFEPAAPFTTEGLACAGAGLVCGYGLTHLAAIPFRRRRRSAERNATEA